MPIDRGRWHSWPSIRPGPVAVEIRAVGGNAVAVQVDDGDHASVAAAYSAAKAGAAGLVRSLARETGRYGITCNVVSLSTLAPALEGEQMEAFIASERTRAQLTRYTIRRFGTPDDVAGMVLFLCSDAASWITGQTYPVNGGYSFAV
ncbi:MAG: SDR family oxidoreductase [Novosphingobium sp.]